MLQRSSELSNNSRYSRSAWSPTWNLFCENSPIVSASPSSASRFFGRMRELLLCPPDYYEIEYEINPWMSVARGAETAIVQEQWKQLHATLSKFCTVHLIPPQPRLPDMVFTANAGLTVGRRFIPSNFRHKERAGEQPFFAKWMEQHGYEIDWLPQKLY